MYPANKIIFTDEQEAQIIDMYVNQHIGCPTIGKKFNVGHKKISDILDSHGIKRIKGSTVRKYNTNEHYFDEIDTPNKAYILGFFYADGNNSIQKGTIRMQLQDIDKEILEKIRIEIGTDRPLKFVNQSKRKYKDYDYNYCDMWSLDLFSIHMCRTLDSKGMVPNKSLVLEFPEWLNPTLYSHFIRGYFDGDGSLCCHYTKKGWFQSLITITSTEQFCKRIQEILINETGISGGGIYEASSKNGITKVLSICGTNQDIAVLNWLYKDADLYMERKYNKYLELLKHQNKSQVA